MGLDKEKHVELSSDKEAKFGDVSVIEFYPDKQQVRVLDVVLDVLPLPEDAKARRFIPSWESMKSHVCWDTPTVCLIRDMAIRLSGGIASRSEGPTGVSKSFAIEVLAALTNRSYLRHNYSKDSDPGDTIGRFVPSDRRLAIRFEELLADEKLNKESREIVEKAKLENRPLTIYESRKVAKNEGISGLEENNLWRWQNGTLTGSMMYGSVFGADEPNLAPGNVVERENSAIEKRAKLRLVEHEGEIIRPLSAEEKSIIDSGGIVPGVVGLDQKFWYVAAQNPWGIGGGRIEESEARRNRLQDRIVESLTSKEYQEYLMFLIHGNQPDISWQGRKFKGEKGVGTYYRDLEKIPNIDLVLGWLATFQTDLQSLCEKGKIGSEKDIKGGSYVYSRRNIERFLDTLKGAQKSLVDMSVLFDKKALEINTNWHDLFMEALYQEYLAGMYREDAELVLELIRASGIEDKLGPSINVLSLPSWVRTVKRNGVDVSNNGGEWILSKLDIQNNKIDIKELSESILVEGYDVSDTGDNFLVTARLKGIMETYQEKILGDKDKKELAEVRDELNQVEEKQNE